MFPAKASAVVEREEGKVVSDVKLRMTHHKCGPHARYTAPRHVCREEVFTNPLGALMQESREENHDGCSPPSRLGGNENADSSSSVKF